MGVKAWAVARENSRVPVPGVKLAKAERSTVAAFTFKVEEPKLSPPPVMARVVETESVRALPKFRVPAAMVREGVTKLGKRFAFGAGWVVTRGWVGGGSSTARPGFVLGLSTARLWI